MPSEKERREPFLSIDENEGMLSAIPLKSGDVIFDISEWDRGEPAEKSEVRQSRFVMGRRDFLKFWEWTKGLV